MDSASISSDPASQNDAASRGIRNYQPFSLSSSASVTATTHPNHPVRSGRSQPIQNSSLPAQLASSDASSLQESKQPASSRRASSPPSPNSAQTHLASPNTTPRVIKKQKVAPTASINKSPARTPAPQRFELRDKSGKSVCITQAQLLLLSRAPKLGPKQHAVANFDHA